MHSLKVCVWGTGTIGERCADYLDNIDAFIDSNNRKHGSLFNNKRVISLDEYLLHYREDLIVIAVFDEQSITDIKTKLNNAGVYNYVLWITVPDEIYYPLDDFPFEKVLKAKNISVQDRIRIYGESYFNFILYDYLEKSGYTDFSIKVDSEKIASWLIGRNYKVQLRENNDSNVKTLYTTKPKWDKSEKKKNDILFYEFSWLHENINSELSVFKDIHSGDRCFIVATGPSIKISDLELLHRNMEWTFSVNRVYKAFDDTNWRPTYYVASDQEMLKTYADDLISFNTTAKFISDNYKPFWDMVERKKIASLFKIHETIAYFGEGRPEFSADISKAIFGAATSIYTCLQIAIYMGFKNIYLIGADCEIKGNGHDDCDHFVKGYSEGAQKAYGLKSFDRAFKAYEAAKEYADANGIHIYNATRGGKLEIFPRVDFDSLFE